MSMNEIKKGKCFIMGAGDLTISQVPLSDEDYLIAVDGGVDYCVALSMEPDLIVGDFDSVSEEEKEAILRIKDEFPEKVVVLKPVKDDTDMLAALKIGLETGYRDFRIYAGMGGRFEHTFANLQCLLFLKKNDAVGYLVDGTGMMFVIKDEAVHLNKNLKGYLSLFSMTKVTKGVSISGMKYELDNYDMTNDFPIGISNEFIGEEAIIQVEDGELACIITYEQ